MMKSNALSREERDGLRSIVHELWRGRHVRPENRASYRPPKVADDRRVYAIGDVHGRADLLQRMFNKIDLHRAVHPCASVVEVMVGDYIDRGPRSRQVIEMIVERRRDRDLRALLGNHENMMLDAIDRPDRLPFWVENGGWDTLLSYGVDLSPKRLRLIGAQEANARIVHAIPPDHVTFLRRLPACFVCDDYVFVHAGIRPGVPLRQQAREDMIWIGKEFLTASGDLGGMVVHGHTQVERPDFRSNRINIDTGAYLTGRLTCLVLDGTKQSVLQTP